jgi:hypothetical protein
VENVTHAYVILLLQLILVFLHLLSDFALLPSLAIDTAKTVLQIDSVEGFRSLVRRVKAGRIGLLYSGAIANAISAILGHYPWVRNVKKFGAFSSSSSLTLFFVLRYA